jgi:glycosyltransferase involved in cell wall biosynthesis
MNRPQVKNGDKEFVCTTIIPTIGRKSLQRAVESVLIQQTPTGAIQLIVVNDSGESLPPSEWQCMPNVRIIETDRQERSFARNTGAKLASAPYLHFLDDDDWLFPGAISKLLNIAQKTDSDWVYGATQLVNRRGMPLIQLRHFLSGNCFAQVMAGEWIPLQSTIIKSQSFFEVGGFNTALSGSEDIDLCRRLALLCEFEYVDQLVASVGMGEEGSSTNWTRHAHQSRLGREFILSKANAMDRMREAAFDSFWIGRIVRCYASSALFNLSQGKINTTFSRALSAIGVITASFSSVFSKSFFRAVMKPYQSQTFTDGQIRKKAKSELLIGVANVVKD